MIIAMILVCFCGLMLIICVYYYNIDEFLIFSYLFWQFLVEFILFCGYILIFVSLFRYIVVCKLNFNQNILKNK